MTSALWAALTVLAALWPARLVGPLDGIPLDAPLEAIGLGVVAAALVVFTPRVLKDKSFRSAVVILLAWKALLSATVSQDGWCVRFTTPQPVYRDMGLVPHAWDLRADWRSAEPTCSALMARAYPSIERFPVWFFNLPPADPKETPIATDRPPLATLQMRLTGFLTPDRPGVLRISFGDDMQVRARVDDAETTIEALASGISIVPGIHHVSIDLDLHGDRWRLAPTWNGSDIWQGTLSTLTTPSAVDRWVRPWGRYVPSILFAWLLVICVMPIARRLSLASAAYAGVMSAVPIVVVATDRSSLIRALPATLAIGSAMSWPRRLSNLVGWRWLVGMPFLALIAALGYRQAGAVTFYSGGDDWWMFQRFAYRIVMQGYWLEGGQTTFWFQPLYRWIVGALHIVFGDSSVGEVFWDGACLLTGAAFAFHVTRKVAGARWGFASAALTLAVVTIGPGWYLVGRGLSEITSAGFVYGGALLALRARGGAKFAAGLAGLFAILAFYARLNNLLMAAAIVAFALPIAQPVGEIWKPSRWWPRVSRTVLIAVPGALGIGVLLFAARTWYYTGVPSILFGTQAGNLSVWQTTDDGETPTQKVVGSVLMVLTMNDPPRFDLRAMPVVSGVVVALLGVCRTPYLRGLPLNAVCLCLAGMSGALVARGTAYPGRFSIHLIPVTVALSLCAVSVLLRRTEDRTR